MLRAKYSKRSGQFSDVCGSPDHGERRYCRFGQQAPVGGQIFGIDPFALSSLLLDHCLDDLATARFQSSASQRWRALVLSKR
jgi:hypothetical protein